MCGYIMFTVVITGTDTGGSMSAAWRAGHRSWWGEVGLVDFLPDAQEEMRLQNVVSANGRRHQVRLHQLTNVLSALRCLYVN